MLPQLGRHPKMHPLHRALWPWAIEHTWPRPMFLLMIVNGLWAKQRPGTGLTTRLDLDLEPIRELRAADVARGTLTLVPATLVTAPPMNLRPLLTELSPLWMTRGTRRLWTFVLVTHRLANLVWVLGIRLNILVMRPLRQRILMFRLSRTRVKALRLRRVILRNGMLLNRSCLSLLGGRPRSLLLGWRR